MATTNGMQANKTVTKSRQNATLATSAASKITTTGGGGKKTNVRTETETKTVGGVKRTITRTFTTETVTQKKTTSTT
mgnify:CR=1 FL=1